MAVLIWGCGENTGDTGASGGASLVVVAPHQDDETILAGATIYRAARDGRTRIEVIYVTAGDAAGLPGPCWGKSEEEKKRNIRELREEEARAACGVLGIDSSHLHFLGYPDQNLVAESSFSEGRRVDVLSEAGEHVVANVIDLLPTLIPPNAENLTVITTSFWDEHPDHRVVYQAARAAGEIVRTQRGIPVTVMHAIVHDEIPINIPFCCVGDRHWPNPGPHLDHSALEDFPERPRPPFWDVVYDVTDLVSVRTEALNQHVSQVKGWPELCMIVFLKRYYYYWMEKTEEVFYKEIL
jgi:LmbE family N-acetylglucosaminyl deacetylase